MKLGTETACLINHIYSTASCENIQVGDPATITGWTDRYAATVTKLFTKGKYQYVTVQQDHAKIVGGTGFGDEVYEYSRNPEGREETYRIVDGRLFPVYKNHNGRWVQGSGGCYVGVRESYRDPSF